MTARGAVALSVRDCGTTGDDAVVHIVGWWQWWLSWLGRRVPRALCGVLLAGDPDRAEPGADAPVCARCAALDR